MENAEPTVSNNAQKKPKKTGRAALFLAVISFLGIIGVAVGGVYLWQSIVQLKARIQQLQFTQQQTQQSLSTFQNSIQSLVGPQAKAKHALSEAEYLVQLADYNLHFQGDTAMAINLLQAADQQLRTVQDAGITSIRQTLANNIIALEAVPKLDLAGLTMRLNALMQQIPKLSLVPTQLTQPEAQKTENVVAPTASLWQRGLESVGHALKEVVVVRQIEHPAAAPLLTPQQQTNLIQNIQLQLSQAQWALLHRQPEIYQRSLQQASAWISQYFIATAASTKSVLVDLAELQKIDIKPVLPDLSDTIKQIQNYNPESSQKNPASTQQVSS